MTTVSVPKRTDASKNSALKPSSNGSSNSRDEMISSLIRVQGMDQPFLVSMPANISTLKGALNPPHPPSLTGRESVMRDLTPLDDNNFPVSIPRRHSSRGRTTSNHHWRSLSNPYDRQRVPNASSSLSAISSRAGMSNLDSSKFPNDICAQLATQIFQTHVQAILEVVRNVSRVQSFTGAPTNATGTHRRRVQDSDESKHRLAQNSYLRRLCDKYESIRLLKDAAGHVEVKFKKVHPGKAGKPPRSEYVDLYPEDSYTEATRVIPPRRSSKWYEGAETRCSRPMKKVMEKMHNSRVKSVLNADVICDGLNKDPWMFDDLVYIFVCGGRRRDVDMKRKKKKRSVRKRVDESAACAGYISTPTLPAHFMDDELGTEHFSPKIQMSCWSHGSHRRSTQQQDSRKRVMGKANTREDSAVLKRVPGDIGLHEGVEEVKYSDIEQEREQPKGSQPKTIRSSSSKQAGKKEEKPEPRGVSKYTTQLMTLPEIVIITSNVGRSANVEEKKTDVPKDKAIVAKKSKSIDPIIVAEKEKEELKMTYKIDRSRYAERNGGFDVVWDDAASEESLFREIANVVERRGDLSGSSVCNSGDGSQAPSLADAPSSISPHVQFETAAISSCGWGYKQSTKDDWLEGIGMATETDPESHVDNSYNFIRHDLWSSTEESKETGVSLFPSIWRTDDSIF